MIAPVSALKRTLRGWREGSANHRILAALITVGGLTLLVRGAGIAKQFAIAWCFGTRDVFDAFLAALLLPVFFVSVVESSFNAAFIPTYVAVRRREGEAAAERLLASVLGWTVAILGLFSIALWIFAGPLLRLTASGFGPAKLATAHTLLLWLLPMLLAGGLTAIGGAVLNARGRFALAAVAPVMTPLLPIVAIVGFGHRFGIYALAAGTVLGALSETAIIFWGLSRHGVSLRGLIPRARSLTAPSRAVRQVLAQLLPMVAGALIMSSAQVVDQAMAAQLGSGSVAALSYGQRLAGFAVGIAALSLGTAILPQFSEMVSDGDFAGIRHSLGTYGRFILLLTVPATLVLVALSGPLTTLIYQRGAFTAADARLVSEVQSLFFLQLPFYLIGILGVRLLSALGHNRTLLAISAVNVVTNLAGDWLLMKWIGLPGIALSTSLVYAASAGLIWWAVKAKLPAHAIGRQACE